MANSADATPIGNAGRRVWSFIKQYGLAFASGIAAGVGVTLAVQHYQDTNAEQEVPDEEVMHFDM